MAIDHIKFTFEHVLQRHNRRLNLKMVLNVIELIPRLCRKQRRSVDRILLNTVDVHQESSSLAKKNPPLYLPCCTTGIGQSMGQHKQSRNFIAARLAVPSRLPLRRG